MTHRHDHQERIATKHPGSKNRLRKLAKNSKQKRRDKGLLRREALGARLSTEHDVGTEEVRREAYDKQHTARRS